MPAKAKQLLFILLQRGPSGLGLELDATNTVVNMVPGGAADTQGYFREGDTIASVDGRSCAAAATGRHGSRVNSYSFDVWRPQLSRNQAVQKALNPVRRAFSFDRKKRLRTSLTAACAGAYSGASEVLAIQSDRPPHCTHRQ